LPFFGCGGPRLVEGELAFLFFQEAPGWLKLGGALLILAGIWLAASRTEG
jgi:drug/metabolite transporter (DMT)-like permease